ncbi:non-specific lipid transfer protein GPI-anchored 2 isoform X1 [Helianthus annuus]|uniref:Bifunctional inhibitor/plant lipid transfer protein/seed storage helical domain-containing protein n=1 Tax=Helianthus annuus TaxID=4232 RepID=A0A251SDK1_HELAN|nr:non-specific lipid transfer protein GPI-anchored 2 isoform X1 [Helianthus annuus]
MASKIVGMVLAIVLIVSICGGAMAQSGCTNALMGMSSCLSFITGNTSTPSSSCCSQLGNVVQSQPQCLCQVMNGAGINLGISINRTLALTLPGACNVQTPPVSQCDAANGPTSTSTPTPAASPEGSTSEPDILPESPTESDTPAGSGSKTDGLTPNGSQSQVPLHLLALVMLVLSWASTSTS